MVLCEDDERRFGGGFLFCVEDFVGGGVCGRGKALSLGARGCGSWFFRDRAGFRTGIFLTASGSRSIGCSSDVKSCRNSSLQASLTGLFLHDFAPS